MRMRPVRHFSRALHQVSVCVRKSVRHSQVRSPNMRTYPYVTTYCCSERSRRAYCPSKSWLTRTNATGRNDLQTAKTLIPRNQSCSRYATINDFSCTETQADGSNSEGIPKRLFFFSRCREASKQNNKNFGPTSPGSRETLFFFFFISFNILFIYFI